MDGYLEEDIRSTDKELIIWDASTKVRHGELTAGSRDKRYKKEYIDQSQQQLIDALSTKSLSKKGHLRRVWVGGKGYSPQGSRLPETGDFLSRTLSGPKAKLPQTQDDFQKEGYYKVVLDRPGESESEGELDEEDDEEIPLPQDRLLSTIEQRALTLEEEEERSPRKPNFPDPNALHSNSTFKDIQRHLYLLRTSLEYYPRDTPVPECLTDDGLCTPWLLLTDSIAHTSANDKKSWKGQEIYYFKPLNYFFTGEPVQWQTNILALFATKPQLIVGAKRRRDTP